MFLAAHVDDMLILHPSKSAVLQVVQEIKKHFEITDLGPVTSYLKVNAVSYTHRTSPTIVRVSQAQVESMLEQ